MLSVVGLALVLFASTNVDDIFVLVAFFADRRFRTASIVTGQYLGIFALLAISVAASLVSLVLSPEHVGLLGLLPVLIGIRKLWDLRQGDQAGESEHRAGAGAVLAVMAVTMANGGDNIGVYTPVLATRTSTEIVAIGIVFAAMTAVWLAAAHFMVNHPRLGAPIRRYGRMVTPFVLIALGILVLHDAGSLRLLIGLTAS